MQRRHDWFKARGYPHFDKEIQRSHAEALVASPARVVTHAFLPFIRYEKIIPRYKPALHRVQEKRRPICYAAHRDSHIFAWYADKLRDPYEQALAVAGCGASVIAYRPLGKSNIHFANAAFNEIERRAPCVALCFDIKEFFDKIDHDLLRARLCNIMGMQRLPDDVYAVFRAITRYAWVDREALASTIGRARFEAAGPAQPICSPQEFRGAVRGGGLVHRNANRFGIPQGSPISAFLSNVYLLPLDLELHALALQVGGYYLRYCDDILFVCGVGDESNVEAAVEAAVRRCNVEVNRDKTERSTFRFGPDARLDSDRHLQYLGFTFDGRRRLIRSSTLARFHRKMRRAVERCAAAAHLKAGERLFRRKLYERYSHLGSDNVLKYGYRAAKIMQAPEMRRQFRRHFAQLEEAIARTG